MVVPDHSTFSIVHNLMVQNLDIFNKSLFTKIVSVAREVPMGMKYAFISLFSHYMYNLWIKTVSLLKPVSQCNLTG